MVYNNMLFFSKSKVLGPGITSNRPSLNPLFFLSFKLNTRDLTLREEL